MDLDIYMVCNGFYSCSCPVCYKKHLLCSVSSMLILYIKEMDKKKIDISDDGTPQPDVFRW